MPKPIGQKSSRPEGWLMAGIKVPLELTARQRKYAARAVGIDRLCFNLAVETHRFHRNNRLLRPSAVEIAKEFNAVKRSGSPPPAKSQNSSLEGALRNFERAIANWRNPELPARKPPLWPSAGRSATGQALAYHAEPAAVVEGDGGVESPPAVELHVRPEPVDAEGE